MIDEIHSDHMAAQDALRRMGCKDPKATLDGFYRETGLDLSDVLYKRDVWPMLERYEKTGEVPENPRGFCHKHAYEGLGETRLVARFGEKWVKAHIYEE